MIAYKTKKPDKTGFYIGLDFLYSFRVSTSLKMRVQKHFHHGFRHREAYKTSRDA